MADIIDRELAWDDEIEKDSDFVLIPEGDYNFTVAGFERGRHDGSEKLPPCPKAIVKLRVELPDGTTQELNHNLFLHSKCEGLLSAFFVGIGQKKHGEKLRMNWNNIIGARGRCKIAVRHWKSDKGEGDSNEIKKFYEPEVAQVAPQQMYGYPQQPAAQAAPAAQVAPAPQYATAPAAQQPVQGVYTPGQW